MITQQHIDQLTAAHIVAGEDLPGTLTDRETGYRESLWTMDPMLVWTVVDGDQIVSQAWWTNSYLGESTTTNIPLHFDRDGELTITHEEATNTHADS